jgi:hydroxylamine reductase
VLVLLALMYLSVRGIRLGPGFLSPAVLSVLVEKFDIKPISTPEQDVAAMMAGR